MVHEVGMVLKQLWSLFLHCGLERLGIGWRDTIPCFGFSPEEGKRESACEGGKERERKEGREGEGGREGGRDKVQCTCRLC